MSDIYDRVIEHLDNNYINVANCPEMHRIMELCLTEEEARLVLSMGHAPMMHGTKNLARKAGMSVERVSALAEGMAERGFIAKARILGRDLYGLLPILPGFYEMTFMKSSSYPEVREELRELWQRYKEKHLVHELGDYETPSMRVIPVNKVMKVEHRIFQYEEVEWTLKRAGTITLGACACREVGRNCDAPKDVCMIMGSVGEFLAEGGFTRQVTLGEAMKALDQSSEANLVHCALNCHHGVPIICNCCSCCCNVLQGVLKHHKARSLVVSSVMAEVEAETCIACGLCEESCQVKALEARGDAMGVNEERCIGCGLCVSHCSTGAIRMKKRPDHDVELPMTFHTLTYKMARDRGKAGSFGHALIKELL